MAFSRCGAPPYPDGDGWVLLGKSPAVPGRVSWAAVAAAELELQGWGSELPALRAPSSHVTFWAFVLFAVLGSGSAAKLPSLATRRAALLTSRCGRRVVMTVV